MAADPKRADRAFGAMIFAFFGAAWIQAWCWYAHRAQPVLYGLIAAIGTAVFVVALSVYRRYRIVPEPPPSAREARVNRAFHIINAGQWVAIFIGVNVLNNIGLGRWDLPLMIGIVGLHFLALAHVFGRLAHVVTGAAMLALALIYPLLTVDGPSDPVGALGTGLILWASALWALRPASPGSG
jgi:hypothetical protein